MDIEEWQPMAMDDRDEAVLTILTHDDELDDMELGYPED